MELSSIIRPEAIRLVSNVTSKKRLFQDLGELASDVYGVTHQEAIDALMDRESLGPTGVGKGIALPHARLPGLKEVIGVFFRLEKPLEFDAVDRQPVDLIFALLAPSESGVEHLKALALVSRTLRDASICAKLRSNVDEATLYAVLTELASEAA
ncbi:MAG: PTS transporter subunit EIIA [Rhodobacteraceae bacterium]|nr:PTS transporter subunit EIIA [Paracoccaceae bacterium]